MKVKIFFDHFYLLIFGVLFFTLFVLYYGYGDGGQVLSRLIWVLLVSLLLFLNLHAISWPVKKSLFAMLWFIATPWVVQKSIFIEHIHYFTLVILFYTYLYLRIKNWVILVIGFFLSLFIGRAVYPQFWIYQSLSLPTVDQFFSNTFKLLSFKLWFFRNIFLGVKNSIGIFYPESLPLFLIGLYDFLKNRQTRDILLPLSPWAIVIFFNNEIVGGREMFIFLPYLSIVFVLGFVILLRRLVSRSSHSVLKAIFVLYLVILLYGLLNFQHYFTIHYLPFDRER